MPLLFSRIFILICFLASCQPSLVVKGSETNSFKIDRLVFSPDGHSLAYTAFSNSEYRYDINSPTSIGLWGINTGKVKNTSKMTDSQFQSIFFSPDGKKLALMYSSRLKTNYGFIWHIDKNKFSEKLSYMPDYLGPTSIIATSPDKKVTAQPDLKGGIRLWNNATKEIIKTYQFEHIKTIYAMQFTADNKRLVIVGRYKPPYYYNSSKKDAYKGPTLIVSFDLSDKSENIVLDTKSTFLSFQNKGHRLLTSTGAAKTIEVWDNFKQTLIQKIKYIGHAKHIQLSDNGRFMAAVIHSGLIIVPDDRPIEMAKRDVVVVWDIKTGLPLHVLTDETHSTQSLAISPDNKTLATGDDKGVIRLWNMETGKLMNSLAVSSLND